jgi:hypothetical protein
MYLFGGDDDQNGNKARYSDLWSLAIGDKTIPNLPKGHLSGGAIAGIVIGGVAFVAILGVAGFFVFKKTYKRRKLHQEYLHIVIIRR